MRKHPVDRKVALITGCSRGIGRACALRLARDGYDIAVHYNRHAAGASAVARDIALLGKEALLVRADVSKAKDVSRMIGKVLDRWGRIDLLVGNAALSEISPVEKISARDWDRLLGVNLRGAFLCCQGVIPSMKRRRSGRIVLLSSQAGQTGGFFIGAHYAASKGGLISLTKTLAKNLAPFGVTVNCVAPGIIDTDMSRSFPGKLVKNLVKTVPLGRIGTAEDVAHSVAFLASDGSSYITGATIPVNGGVHMPS